MARARRSERLSEEMQATLDADPITGDRQRVSHFYFTAVPTHGRPDMYSQYTSDPESRMRLLQRCANLANDIRRADGDQRPTTMAYAALSSHRRTQRVAVGWVQTWPAKPGEGPGYRTVGVDDDGPIRYINLGAAGALSIDPDTKLLHEV
jgi:hypothetical protein